MDLMSKRLNLGSDVPQQVFYVLSYESVLHDRLPVHLEDLLKLVDVVVLGGKLTLTKKHTPDLVGSDKVGHGNDLVVIFVGLRLLRVKGIDSRLHQHVGQH